MIFYKEQQIEFLELCIKHRDEGVRWRCKHHSGEPGEWVLASERPPYWDEDHDYEF